MNPLNINCIKIEKANSIKLKYQKLRKITNFFRVFEIFLVVAVISRISLQLPLTLVFKLSNEYLHSLSLILVSPRFVFILGNAIVITLFVSSGNFNPPCNDVKPPKSQCKKITKSQPKKQGETEHNTAAPAIFAFEGPPPAKVYHRSKSEKLRREKIEKGGCCGGLRRSNTEVKSLKGKEYAGEGYYPEDHMSNEEFRRTIEDFIAKQQRLLIQEEDFSDLRDL